MKWLKHWKTQTLLLLAVIGPGFITANVDNDAGGIFTYSQAGAQYGYTLLWTLIPITLALIVVQEMSARMGACHRQGPLRPDPRRIRPAHHFCHDVASGGHELHQRDGGIRRHRQFHGAVSRLKVHQRADRAAIVWFLVVKGNYKSVEKVFLIASFFYVAYIIAGVLSRPNWHDAAVSTVKLPTHAAAFPLPGYVYMVIGMVGTTIAPWMQFYLQASMVEKGVTARLQDLAD